MINYSHKMGFFMTSEEPKNSPFNWQEGDELDDKNYNPLGGVRAKGIPKLKKAVHADPIMRKTERDEAIKRAQNKVYRPEKRTVDDDSLIIEESHSGLTGDYEDSAAKKIIDAGKKIKGVARFGKKK